MKKILMIFLAFVAVLSLCVAGHAAWGDPPRVILTYPANGDANVDVAVGTLYLNFDSIMDASSFRDRISIDNDAVIDNLTFGVWGSQVRINLTGNLKYSTRYTVTTAKQVKDNHNNQMGITHSFSFTTMAKPNTDTTRPVVSATSPVSSATDVAVTAPVAITFSEVMDPATINTSTITVSNGVTGVVSLDASGKVATFTPSSNLASFTSYTVTVSTGVRDLAGNALATAYTWNFRTMKTDTIPPTVTVVTPLNGATDVALNSRITAVFSEAVDPATISAATFTLNGVTGTVTYDATTFTATFTPSADLAHSTNYTATLSTVVQDLAGNRMAQSKTWSFTTVRPAQTNLNYYCHIPPFVMNSASALKPNVLLMVDNSGSMYEFAYKNPGSGNNSYDTSYSPSINYYGYFDSNRMYKYMTTSGGFFQVDSSKAQDNASFWSGNFLNWLTMRRVDIVRKILVGGKTQPRSANSANYLYGAESPDRDYYKSYNNVRYQLQEGTSTGVIRDVTNDMTYSIKIYVGDQPQEEGIIPRYRERINFGIMFFNDGYRYEDQRNSVRDGGNVVVDIGSNGTNLITQIENTDPETWTPLGESLYEATRYFQATTSAFNGGTYSGKDPIQYPCQKNFVMILTDGESTKDQNIPGSNWNRDDKVTDPNGFNVKTYMDKIAVQEGYGSQWDSNANTSEGTYYLEGVAYYSHVTDFRTATVGKSDLPGKQNLTIYTVFAFDDSPIGRDILKKTAKYGGFEDYDNTGKPDKVAKWDKNGDGIPDTFYEAREGAAMAAEIEKAVLDILARVSAGTAASILSNSEGSGANILQAVFYPRKAFENSEATWIGEMQNLWYYIDPLLQNSTVREDTADDNVLNLRQDRVVNFRFEDGQTVVDLLDDSNGDGAGDAVRGTVTPDALNSLWRAGKLLWERSSARTIYTQTSGSLINFTSSAAFNPATTNNQALLQAANETEASKIINFTKGLDQSGYRNRTVTIGGRSGVWKLGDIVSSTPRLQSFGRLATYDSPPSGGYSDTSYKSFINSNQYKSRGMVYAGANDGMLHAFKLGTLDVTSAGDRRARLTGDDLGEEQWAFIPKNALPYLKYLADPEYNHLYYVDGPTVLFDASIGIPDGCATDYSLCVKNTSTVDGSNNLDPDKNSWRSILIGSMGYGGASRKTCASGNCVQTPISDPADASKGLGYSSYFALDITDPANPTLLWEFTHEDLGFSTTGPAIMRIGEKDKNGKWFVVLGNGPSGPMDTNLHRFLARSDKPLKLFVLDLKSGTLLRTIDATEAPFSMSDLQEAYVGSLIGGQTDTDRWDPNSNGNYKDDALYFGYVKKEGDGDDAKWTQGGVMRLLTKESVDPAEWTVSKVVDNIGPVTTSISRLTDRKNHKFWLYFGTGRYYFNADDSTSRRSIFGVKEPCYTAADDINQNCNTAALQKSNLTDQSLDTAADTLGQTTGDGWFIDLDAADATYGAERIITDPVALTNGSVFFTSFKPTADACGFGGSSYVWATKFDTGFRVPQRTLVGKIVLQLSTGSFEQVNIKDAFTARAGRKTSTPMPGKPPGDPPPIITNANNKPVKKIMHIKEM